MQIGYARVSTLDQDTALQKAAFRKHGIRKVIEEKKSGCAERPELEKILQNLKPGDILCVYKMDRLSRSLVDLLRILDRIQKAGAHFKSLTEPIETSTPVGRMMVQLLGAVAEFEREVIRERCAAGRAQAMEKGVAFGRRPKVDRLKVLELKAQGLTYREIGQAIGASETAASRAARGVRKRDGGPGDRAWGKALSESHAKHRKYAGEKGE